jgi:hypothetical protein
MPLDLALIDSVSKEKPERKGHRIDRGRGFATFP